MSTTQKKSKPERRKDRPSFEQTAGPGAGRVFELSRDILSMGRTDDNEIVLKSESVSRCHAYLKRVESGKWIIQDNNSKNGVRVNGAKQREVVLEPGDLVAMGEFTFRFTGAEETPPPIAAPPPRRAPKAKKNEVLQKWMSKAKVWGKQAVVFGEKHAWVVGVGAGLVIGGGLYWKARVNSLPPAPSTALTPAPKAKGNAVVATPVAEQPATFASEKNSEPVTKNDMAVSNRTKKPGSELRDLNLYLREGREYLKEGDKESAVIAFQFALVLSPGNKEALAGLKAAGVKAPVSAQTPPKEEKKAQPSPETKNRAKVADLLKAAVDAFKKGSYTAAIEKAEAARRIEIPGQTEYLNEAKQIIDRARDKQKEEFEPFLESALKKIEQGDFAGSAALCEEMLRLDPAYAPAKECLAKSMEALAGRRKD